VTYNILATDSQNATVKKFLKNLFLIIYDCLSFLISILYKWSGDHSS